LFDVTGKVMKKISAVNENRFELNRDDLGAIVYFYRITTKKGKTCSEEWWWNKVLAPFHRIANCIPLKINLSLHFLCFMTFAP
jgi:hypothetical protein